VREDLPHKGFVAKRFYRIRENGLPPNLTENGDCLVKEVIRHFYAKYLYANFKDETAGSGIAISPGLIWIPNEISIHADLE
jgi:hypothetical protein